MANLIPSAELVANILRLNMLDYQSSTQPGMTAIYSTGERAKDMRARSALLDKTPERVFREVLEANPDLMHFYANLYVTGNLWHEKNKNAIHIPETLKHLIPSLMGFENALGAIRAGGDITTPFTQMSKAVEAFYIDRLLPDLQNFDTLMPDYEGAITRKEMLEGDTFTLQLEDRLEKVARWAKAATREMLAANETLQHETAFRETGLPKPLARAAANLSEIQNLLTTEMDRVRCNASSQEALGFRESAEWWKRYAVDHSTPKAMRAADDIVQSVERLGQTPVGIAPGKSLLDMLDANDIWETQARIATDALERLEPQVRREIQSLRGRHGPETGR